MLCRGNSDFHMDWLWLVCISSFSELVFSAGLRLTRVTSKRFWELPAARRYGGCVNFVHIAALRTNPQGEVGISSE